MRRNGVSFYDISKIFKVEVNTIKRWIGIDYKIKKKPKKIKNLCPKCETNLRPNKYDSYCRACSNEYARERRKIRKQKEAA